MSNLSLPPLEFVPVEIDAPKTNASAPLVSAPEPFAWPTPPCAAFGAPVAMQKAEPAELEGANGKITQCRLLAFDTAAGTIVVHVPPARRPLELKLAQFRRLSLLKPLARLPASPGDPELPLVQATLCVLRFRDGTQAQLSTVGHVDEPFGLFTFTPVDESGAVRRNFHPRSMLAGVSHGQRIGEVLVEQRSASAAQIEAIAAEQQRVRAQRVGEILLGQQVVTADQLMAAIEQQARMPMVKIGEALLALGFVEEAQLTRALTQQKQDRSVPLGEMLVRMGVVTRTDLQTALARKMGYPVVDVSKFTPETEALQKLPATTARRIPALPLVLRGGRLVVALEDPTARPHIDEIEFSTQCRVLPVLALERTVAQAADKAYGRLGQLTVTPSAELLHFEQPQPEIESAEDLIATLEIREAYDARRDEPQIEQSDNSLVRLINTMILEARQQGASDIHIECPGGAEKVRVRFRRDGTLRPYMELPPAYRQAIIARIKIMCDLDISERRKPQDGKISFGRFVQGQNLELRVATIPTVDNVEDAVLRLLATSRALPLDKMGLGPDTLEQLRAAISRPHGIVLCVGPTGSGKTTTLHAALAHLNVPERKIWTAEDPVEITQQGLRQIQVNPRIGWTFAKALRALLRADPDVVMIGEIRDLETAEIAIEASLTGHLVLSTLHTNSAAETVGRLLDLGLDPFSFADSLVAVLSQRLLRRPCPHCAQPQPASSEFLESLAIDYLNCYPNGASRPSAESLRSDWQTQYGGANNLSLPVAAGCSKCDGTGLSGRVGIHELLVVDAAMRQLVQRKAPAAEIHRAAMAGGMRTLRQDGIRKVLAGQTTIEEVRAATAG